MKKYQETLAITTQEGNRAHMPGYTAVPTNKLAPFNSMSQRFTSPSSKNSPGPGAYTVSAGLKKRLNSKASIVSTSGV